MAPFKRLLHKKVVVGLLLSFLFCLLVSQFIPQRAFLSPEERIAWQSTWPFLAGAVQKIGLDHLWATQWFFLLTCLVLLVLLLSLKRQWRKIRVVEGGSSSGRMVGVADSLELVEQTLNKLGYRFICRKNSSRCYLRDRIGLWGGPVLHLGLAFIIVWGLINACFYDMRTAELYEGEQSGSPSAWRNFQQGPFASDTHMPDFRLVAVLQDFYGSGQLKAHRSIITVGQATSPVTIAINEPLSWQGWRLYQGSRFGHTFFISVTDQRDTSVDRLAIQLDHPKRNGAFLQQFSEIQTKFGSIAAAYHLDGASGAGDISMPVLTLKVPGPGMGRQEVTLRRGQEVRLGMLTMKLDTIKKWTTLNAVKLYVLPLLFSGFILVVIGGYLLYCMAPRQMVLTEQGEKVLLKWQAFRFRALYRDEPAAILAGISAGGLRLLSEKKAHDSTNPE